MSVKNLFISNNDPNNPVVPPREIAQEMVLQEIADDIHDAYVNGTLNLKNDRFKIIGKRIGFKDLFYRFFDHPVGLYNDLKCLYHVRWKT